MRSKTTIFALVLTSIISIFIFGSTAYAQDNISLSISPTRLESEASKGQTIEETVTISNISTHKVSLVSSAMDFIPQDDSGKPKFVPANKSPWSMSGWIKTKPARIDLNPEEKAEVKVIINVPKNAEPGGHYAAALFANEKKNSSNAAITAKIGSLILLTVKGKIIEQGEAMLKAPRLVEKGPVDLTVHFKNKGNVHVKPAGNITISRLWGSNIKDIEIGNENVLPKSMRSFTVQWNDIPSVGVFIAKGDLKYGASDKTTPIPQTVIFTFPWRLTLAGTGIFLAGMLFNILLKRRTAKKNIKEHEPTD